MKSRGRCEIRRDSVGFLKSYLTDPKNHDNTTNRNVNHKRWLKEWSLPTFRGVISSGPWLTTTTNSRKDGLMWAILKVFISQTSIRIRIGLSLSTNRFRNFQTLEPLVFTWLLKINYFTATLQPHTYFTTQPQGSPMSVHYDILCYSRSGIGDYSMDEGW